MHVVIFPCVILPKVHDFTLKRVKHRFPVSIGLLGVVLRNFQILGVSGFSVIGK